MKTSSNQYITEEDLYTILLYSRKELRQKNQHTHISINDLSPRFNLFGGRDEFIKFLSFLKLYNISLSGTCLFADISEKDLALPNDQSLSHLPDKEKAEAKNAIKNISSDQFSQKDIEIVLPHSKHFLSSICFLPDLTQKQTRILRQALNEYIQDFIDGGLLILERNALIFELQKDQFFNLILSSRLLEKYGRTFVVENTVGGKSDFFYIHTLLALEKLGYIILNQVDTFFNGELGSGTNYRVNLKLNQVFIEEMSRKYQKENPEAVYASYDTASGTLYFSGKKIELSKSNDSDAVRLMGTILKNIKDNWSKDAIFDDWNYTFDEQRNLPKLKMYQAAVRIQTAIAKKTQVEDFLIFSTKEVRVNPKYIPE